LDDESAKRHYPSSALVLNLPEPTAASPCLLLLEKLRQVFHELGHGMHNLVSKTVYGRFHGTNADTDFIEVPGKLFEHILWTPSVLQQLSCHYSHLFPTHTTTWRTEKSTKYAAGKPRELSRETIETILAAKEANATLSYSGPLSIALFDMAVHGRSESDLSAGDLASLYYKTRKEVTGLEGLGPESYAFSTLRSIMGNYDAGYYTYML
jgi:metallopeptidase MepB